jgi:Family of unknown function (DUF6428)
MTIQELKKHLASVDALRFVLPSQEAVPAYFHITEVGLSTKHFVDCGGTIRQERAANFQIWFANDTEHRLSVAKFLKIVEKAQPLYQDENIEIEVEYQTELSLSKFGLEFVDGDFQLTSKHTACLAMETCGTTAVLESVAACCTPNSSCC